MDGSTGKAHLHRRRWHATTTVVVAAGLFATLSACTADPADPERTPVEIAQADVAAKEKALTEAQTAATDAEAQFCTAGSTYITALDRCALGVRGGAGGQGGEQPGGRDDRRRGVPRTSVQEGLAGRCVHGARPLALRGGSASGSPSRQGRGGPQARAAALSLSNSPWSIAPESSSALAWAIWSVGDDDDVALRIRSSNAD